MKKKSELELLLSKIKPVNVKPIYSYYVVNNAYRGTHIFRTSNLTDTVVKVTVNAGEVKRGRSSVIGISIIDKTNFFANYHLYLKECDKQLYIQARNNVLKMFL